MKAVLIKADRKYRGGRMDGYDETDRRFLRLRESA